MQFNLQSLFQQKVEHLKVQMFSRNSFLTWTADFIVSEGINKESKQIETICNKFELEKSITHYQEFTSRKLIVKLKAKLSCSGTQELVFQALHKITYVYL